MKKHFGPVFLLLALAAGLIASFANAQDTNIKRVPARPTVAVDGKTLFNQYCAVCHGQDGKGQGPAAGALKARLSDLTQISKRNNGKFPEQQVMNTLKGIGVTAHGTGEMPVWGPIFSNMNSDLHQGQMRIFAVSNYLEELQAK